MGVKYPMTTVPNSLRKFLKGLADKSVPPKVTEAYLRSVGLTSSNDRSIIHAMKNVGLLDPTGTPTEIYKKMRNKAEGPVYFAGALRKAYKPLYDVYEDAHSQSDENLKNVFRETADHLSASALEKVLATFKAVCEFANFDQPEPAEAPAAGAPPAGPTPAVKFTPGSPSAGSHTPQIHVNVQIHIPESKDPAIYDSIFEALVRHIRKMV